MIKKLAVILAFVLLAIVAVLAYQHIFARRQNGIINNTSDMKLSSSAFLNSEPMPPVYTCDGDNINPPLVISDTPEATKSLALVVDDPDAPAGNFNHWLLWNIAPETALIAENSLPQGSVEGTTSFGQIAYGGPCPHNGSHRYFFRLFALSETLNLPKGSEEDDLMSAMKGKIISQAELIATYKRR